MKSKSSDLGDRLFETLEIGINGCYDLGLPDDIVACSNVSIILQI